MNMDTSTRLSLLEAQIVELCDSVTWTTTSIFMLSLFLTILRPDPTLTVCLIGFYGAHVRSFGAIRSFWFFLLMTVIIDVVWLLMYSPLRPLDWDMLTQLARKDQLSATLSVLNMTYKLMVIYSSIHLQMCFSKREELIKQMERDAGIGASERGAAGVTSSGEPVDARSLAAQAGQ